MAQSRQTNFLWLALIVLTGAALRLARLDGVPPGLWFDEGLNAQDVARTLGEFGPQMIYTGEWAPAFPREPLFIWILSAVGMIVEPSELSLRLTTAFIGLATVVALYWALREDAGEPVALTAAGILATLRWHVIFSRLIFRTLLLPLWITLIVGVALRLRRRPTRAKGFALGLLMGGGFYTYLAWYFMLPGVLLLALWALYPALREKSGRPVVWICLAAALFTAAPLGVHYARHPDHLLSRPAAVAPAADGEASAVAAIGKNVVQALGMFHVYGDHVAKVNLPGKPALDPISGTFFVLGVLMCVVQAARRRPLEAILLGWLVLGMATTALTKTDSPNFLRSLVLTPAVSALAAIGMWRIFSYTRTKFPRFVPPYSIAILTVVLIGGSGFMTARDVFVRWPAMPEVWHGFNTGQTEVGRAATEAPEGTSVWLPAHFARHPSIVFLIGDKSEVYEYENFSFLRVSPESAGPRWVMATNDNGLYPILDGLVPEGEIVRTFVAPEGNTWALFYEVPAGKLPARELVDRAEASHPVKDIRR